MLLFLTPLCTLVANFCVLVVAKSSALLIAKNSALLLTDYSISERYRQGEHFVKPEVVMERYVNGLNLLNHYFNRPDILELFDNTKKMVRLAEISQGQIIEVIESLPNWVTQYLGPHFQQQIEQQKKVRELGSIEEVRKSYEVLKAKADSLLQKKDQSQDDLNEQKKNTNRQKPRGL